MKISFVPQFSWRHLNTPHAFRRTHKQKRQGLLLAWDLIKERNGNYFDYEQPLMTLNKVSRINCQEWFCQHKANPAPINWMPKDFKFIFSTKKICATRNEETQKVDFITKASDRKWQTGLIYLNKNECFKNKDYFFSLVVSLFHSHS